MDFNLSDEALALQKEVRDLVQRVLVPTEPEMERTGVVPDVVMSSMREAGLFGLNIAPDFGGLGLDCLTTAVIIEELGWSHSVYRSLVTNNIGIGSQSIAMLGTEAQKKKYLPGLASGELLSSFALSEPNAGSDTNALKTTARRDGDHYVLNGMKHFCTNASKADIVTVMAVSSTDPKARDRVTSFIVERETPGFRVSRIQETMGAAGYAPAELVFEDCRVHESQRVGPEGKGLTLALDVLAHGRVILASAAVGLAQRLLTESIKWARLRVQFGKPIGENQGIQFMLADMAVRVQTSRLLVREAAWLVDQKRCTRKEAGMAKLHASESLGFVADSAVQIFGGMGYMRELPIERMYREARVFRIVEGTSEIQRMIIAKDLLRE